MDFDEVAAAYIFVLNINDFEYVYCHLNDWTTVA